MAESFYKEAVAAPAIGDINTGLTAARHSTMLADLGVPGSRTHDCSAVTNANLRALMATRSVGPFTVTGIRPAVESLETLLKEVKQEMPGLYAILGTAGMLCCRAVRGRPQFFSNHSWGTAVDIKIGGILAPLDAKSIPRGLLLIYPFFHRHGWFWGAGYHGRTDPMHFEIATETIVAWKREGKLSAG